MQSAGKSERGAMHGENVHPMPSAGKGAPGAKRGKMCTRCQAQEKVHPMPSAGKGAPDAKRRKVGLVRHLVPKVGKHVFGDRGEKICVQLQAREQENCHWPIFPL